MTKQDWVDFILRAKPGQQIVYHRGLLMQDRDEPFGLEAHKIGKMAWNAYQAGKVVLLQRRIHDAEPSACEYIAVRT